MYVLNTSKSAVPSIGENVLQRNIKTVTFRTPTAKTLTSNYHNQKWSLKSAPPYKLVEHTKATLLDASKFKDKFLSSVTQMRNFVQSSRQDQMKGQNDGQKPLPRLLYIQNPLVWVTNKIDFRHLRVAMDPSFTEKEFTRGARQAISRVTQLLSLSNFDSMKPLFTKSALLTLRREVELLWTDEVRRNIALEPHDIQLIIPRKLHFRNVDEKSLCDIDVVFIGLKHLPFSRNDNPALLFVDIISRFHRNYTDGAIPEWTIAAFKVRKFNVIPTKTS